MARRPLLRILTGGRMNLARSRGLARSAADGATDVLQPLITLARGLGRLALAGRRRWTTTPKERRGPLLFLVAAAILVVTLAPYGPLMAVVTLMSAAAWHGRDRSARAAEGSEDTRTERLRSLYEALVPFFSTAEDPAPLYSHGGDWQQAFPSYEFDDSDRLSRLEIRYPAYFTDGEADSRARVEQLLHVKAGRGREYHFAWDEEGNRLAVSALAPLPTDIAAQRFVTAPGETVLGFTDPTEMPRTLPLADGQEQRDVPPVVWRTGPRSTEPHLLALGQPGSGTSTLLRCIALQALRDGEVLIVDGGGTGDFACLADRDGVLGIESSPVGAHDCLAWAVRETEHRLLAAAGARRSGRPVPDEALRPLWILVDRPGVLGHLADSAGYDDPQSLLQVPLRHGRAARVTVVVTEHLESADALSETVRRHTRARVVLGPASADQLTSLLGTAPSTTPPPDLPPGRGYARLGSGPVHRIQVPATPDPYDEAAGDAHRQAVLALLPPPARPEEAAGPEPATVPAEAVDHVKPADMDMDKLAETDKSVRVDKPVEVEPVAVEPTAVEPAAVGPAVESAADEPADAKEPVGTGEPATAVLPAGPERPADGDPATLSAGESTDAVQPAHTADATHTSDTADTADTVKSLASVKSADSSDPVNALDHAKAAQPAEAAVAES